MVYIIYVLFVFKRFHNAMQFVAHISKKMKTCLMTALKHPGSDKQNISGVIMFVV